MYKYVVEYGIVKSVVRRFEVVMLVMRIDIEFKG